MQALRVASRARLPTSSALALRRTMATTTQPMPSAAASEESHLNVDNAKRARQTRAASDIPLSNVEAQWDRLSAEEQAAVYGRLEEIQKRDWNTLSVDEKKAAWFVSFGPHGPRAPLNPPGTTGKIIGGLTAIIAASTVIFVSVRSIAPPPPRTITREWEEAANERAKEMNLNPISGISSEGYSGQGFVTTK